MKRPSGFSIVGLALAVVQAPVDAQRALFPSSQTGQTPTELRFRVDFTPAPKSQVVVVSPRVGTVVTRLPHTASADQPIDCRMARPADPALDTKFETPPPAGVTHAMRLIQVPACPARLR